MYIYQVERDLLQGAVGKLSPYLEGELLDVGSGSYNRYSHFLKNISGYTSLDVNPSCNPNIVGSADNIPVGDGSFDSIICIQTLGDLLYPEKAIKEFRRILRGGGRILITEGFMNEIHGEPRDFWRFTPYGLSGLVRDNGFRIIEQKITGGFFTVIVQMTTRLLINGFSLYRHGIVGRLFSKSFLILGKLAIALDKLFASKANARFGLNVVLLAEALPNNE